MLQKIISMKPLKIIKKGKEDLEKPVNNSINCRQKFFLVIVHLILFNSWLCAQTNNIINSFGPNIGNYNIDRRY